MNPPTLTERVIQEADAIYFEVQEEMAEDCDIQTFAFYPELIMEETNESKQ